MAHNVSLKLQSKSTFCKLYKEGNFLLNLGGLLTSMGASTVYPCNNCCLTSSSWEEGRLIGCRAGDYLYAGAGRGW